MITSFSSAPGKPSRAVTPLLPLSGPDRIDRVNGNPLQQGVTQLVVHSQTTDSQSEDRKASHRYRVRVHVEAAAPGADELSDDGSFGVGAAGDREFGRSPGWRRCVAVFGESGANAVGDDLGFGGEIPDLHCGSLAPTRTSVCAGCMECKHGEGAQGPLRYWFY